MIQSSTGDKNFEPGSSIKKWKVILCWKIVLTIIGYNFTADHFSKFDLDQMSRVF